MPFSKRQWLIMACGILFGIVGGEIARYYHLFTFESKGNVLWRLDANMKSTRLYQRTVKSVYKTPPQYIKEWLVCVEAYNVRHDNFRELIMAENYLKFTWNSITGSRERMRVSLNKERKALNNILSNNLLIERTEEKIESNNLLIESNNLLIERLEEKIKRKSQTGTN